MRSLILLVLLLTSTVAPAAQVDSSASGVYLGVDRVCRIVLYRWAAHWVNVDLRCLPFEAGQTNSLTTVYAPNNCPQGIAYMLNPWPPEAPREYLNLLDYDPVEKTLRIVRGTDQNAVTNGIGISEVWFRIGYAPSPAPYICVPVPSRIDPNALARYCREHPTVPACR